MESFVMDLINTVLEKNVFLVYVMFFISSILQLVFPPHPADVVLVFEGYITTLSQSFGFVPVLVNAMAGTLVGSAIVYKFGYIKGDAVFKYKLINKYIDLKHRRRAEKLIEKYGACAIIVSKFVPGVNAIILLFAGIFKLKPRVVYLSILPTILLHHTLVLLLGRFLGDNLDQVKTIISTYNGIVIALVLIAGTCYAIYWLLKRKRVGLEKNTL